VCISQFQRSRQIAGYLRGWVQAQWAQWVQWAQAQQVQARARVRVRAQARERSVVRPAKKALTKAQASQIGRIKSPLSKSSKAR
jgi:hypothetical protein